MKTIEEAAKENSEFFEHKEAHRISFLNGVEFAQYWISVEEELSCCFEDGVFDGLRSEWVLVKDSFGEWHKARLYSGTIDGQQFNDWYDERDYELRNIISWRPIERR